MVSVPVGSNKPIDKNATGQHCGTDHDAEDGHPNDSRDVHRGMLPLSVASLRILPLLRKVQRGGENPDAGRETLMQG